MSKDLPNSIDIQKDISKYLSDKYGGRIVVSNPDIEGGHEGVNSDNSRGNTNFKLKPLELEKYLKEYVIQQEEAIDVLATKICTHFNRMVYEKNMSDKESIIGNVKSNILMIGPTGVGKTYITKLIAMKLGVPFVKGDATKFTETGYVGGDVEDLIRELVREAGGDISSAEYGIVYLDEIDKIASSTNHYGPDVSRTGVQRNLLKVMEDTEVELKSPMDMASQMEAVMQAQKTGKVERKKISTKNILFVMSGAFHDISEIIKKRLNQQPLGFTTSHNIFNNSNNDNLLKHVKGNDLIDYGFESEFVGRLPIITVLDDLSVKSLYKILDSPKSSVVLGKKRDFSAYGIKIDFESDALQRIAELAFQEKTGARGLVSICEKILIKFEKYLPSTSIKELLVSKRLVESPNDVLVEILIEDAIDRVKEEFNTKHSISISFNKESIGLILTKSKEQNTNPFSFCHSMLADYEYGLKLIGKNSFTVTEEVVNDHRQFLDNLIKKAYEKTQANKS